ncbi:hypothetical protein B6U99_07645 [Candidatus Geothermarchaeota archaeon ex4572_27]|nr:MAG: hypothetical protein B6U99_07645 [Candidatus Geothermarchaeota archaeon ex4572_27]
MELSEALRRLSEGAPILVYGEGGAGKTTLIAVMLAEEAREGHYVAYAYTGDVGLYRFKRVFEVNAPPRQLALIKIASFWEQDRLVDALYRARGGGLRAIGA